MSESLAHFFRQNFQAHVKDRAYGQRRGYRMEWFTYAQVLEMALDFRGELKAHGIAKGERVMLWGENCAEWVAAFFGCVLSGVVVVPMDDAASPAFAARVAGRGFCSASQRRLREPHRNRALQPLHGTSLCGARNISAVSQLLIETRP